MSTLGPIQYTCIIEEKKILFNLAITWDGKYTSQFTGG